MEPDELTWIDSVPVRPARGKRITIGEYEWVRAAPSANGPGVLTARFWLNSIELMAILIEEATVAQGGSTEQPPGPASGAHRRSLLPALRGGTGAELTGMRRRWR